MVMGMAVLIVSIALHEFGHAIMADKLGDRLPRSQGRVTLNPVAHADPIGTLVFPLLGFVWSGGAGFGFGWGRPVMVNPLAFTRKLAQRTAHMLVALAGPMMNILQALVYGGIYGALVRGGVVGADSWVAELLVYAVFLNFILAFFNLIPAHPLDGGAVVEGLLPRRALDTWGQIKVYGPFILMSVIFIPQLQPIFMWPATKCFVGYMRLVGA